MIRTLAALGCAWMLLWTFGCGTKGPLYLPHPDTAPAREQAPAPAAAG